MFCSAAETSNSVDLIRLSAGYACPAALGYWLRVKVDPALSSGLLSSSGSGSGFGTGSGSRLGLGSTSTDISSNVRVERRGDIVKAKLPRELGIDALPDSMSRHSRSQLAIRSPWYCIRMRFSKRPAPVKSVQLNVPLGSE